MPMRNLTALSLLAALLPLSPYSHGEVEDAVDVLAAGRLSAVSIGALSTNRTSTVALEASADVSADLSVAGTASFARGVARLPPAPGLPMGAHTNVGHAAEGTPRPAWWTELGVLDPSAEPNDFALAVQGQVKWIASRAAHGLGEAGALAGGSGPACSALAAAFTPSNNALPVTLGQLKATAAPFWARLAELAPSSAPPPWAEEAAPQDFALVNVGQVKAAFSFELPPPLDPEADEDGDGMPNGWEMSYGLDPLDRFDVCDDPDGDGIPNVYEYHHGLDPRVDDADFLEKIVVGGDAPGAVPTLKAAFAASRPYSVIEIAPGAYQGSGWTRLWFPEHPVLVTSPDGGRNRQVVIRDVGSGTCATFYLAARQTVHTVVQGIYLDLASTDGLQMGFWCGGNLPWSGTPAAGMFRNVYIRMSKPGVDYMGWFFRHWESNEVVIAGCTLNAAGATRARGIYAVDSPPMSVENCSFLRFPRAESPNLGYGIQYETTEQNWSGAPDPIPLEIVNCLFDGSFTNAYALAPLEMGVEYDVTMLNCLVPSPLEYEADHVGNLLVTNALVAFSGHLASDSPAIGAGAPVLYSRLDLDGQDRDAWPDIGADECIPLDASLDTDGDGLTDMVEIGQTNTDPFLLDTDGDGVDDRTEIAQGTDPTDPRSFLQTLTVAVTNAVALANVTNYVAWGFSPTDWEANGLAAVTGTGRSVVYTNASTAGAAYVKCFRDLDRNGVYDADRDIFLVRAIPSGGVARLAFSFGDVDGDNVPDHVERAEGTDPYDAKNYRLQTTVRVTDVDAGYGCTNYLAVSCTEDGWNLVETVTASAQASFSYRIDTVVTGGVIFVKCLHDINGNGDFDPLMERVKVNRLYAVDRGREINMTVGDSDGDGVPDHVELEEGTDPLDAKNFRLRMRIDVANSDSDCGVTNYLAVTQQMAADWNSSIAVTSFVGFAVTSSFDEIVTNGVVHVLCRRAFDSINGAEVLYRKTVGRLNNGKRCYMAIGDWDGDGILDSIERAEGTDPYGNTNYCFNLTATVAHVFEPMVRLTAIAYLGDEQNLLYGPCVQSNGMLTVNFEHLSSCSRERVSFLFWEDLNEDGICDTGERRTVCSFPIFGHDMYVTNNLALGDFDVDEDGMLDDWELLHGFSPSDAADAVLDADDDGFINLHEFCANTNPNDSLDDGNGTMLRIMTSSVDNRIFGKQPDISKPYYVDYGSNARSWITDLSLANFSLNTNCWLYGVDLSCLSIWSDYYPYEWACPLTLISPQHVIMASHVVPSNGTSVVFRSFSGNTFVRVLIDSKPLEGVADNDLCVGILNAPLPEDIKPIRWLPGNYMDYIGNGRKLPLIRIGGNKSCNIQDIVYLAPTSQRTRMIKLETSTNPTRREYYRAAIAMDSGHPLFLLFNDEPVFLCPARGFYYDDRQATGFLCTYYKNLIQSTMDFLSDTMGKGRYTIQECSFDGAAKLENTGGLE